MPTNPYFNYAVKSEQNLYEDLVIESIKMYGMDLYYLPRTIVNEDSILKDDIPSKFSSAYKIEMYIENVDGYAGEGDLFQKFGIEIRDQATFVIAKKRWKETVAAHDNTISGNLPAVGDLIYLPLSKSLFQIMHVERESPFYQLSNLPMIRLECELFEYNDEDMDTGIQEIDNIEQLGYQVNLVLNADSDLAPITIGETVTQTLSSGVVISGEVIEWNKATQTLGVAHIGTTDGKYHMFNTTDKLTSTNWGIERTIVSVNEDLGDHGYQNDVFDSDVGFLTFTESNPFGDPN